MTKWILLEKIVEGIWSRLGNTTFFKQATGYQTLNGTLYTVNVEKPTEDTKAAI